MADKYSNIRLTTDGTISEKGEYLLAPFLQEDGSYAFWISKIGMTVAQYCFTIGHGGNSYAEQLIGISGYVRLFQEKFEKEAHPEVTSMDEFALRLAKLSFEAARIMDKKAYEFREIREAELYKIQLSHEGGIEEMVQICDMFINECKGTEVEKEARVLKKYLLSLANNDK